MDVIDFILYKENWDTLGAEGKHKAIEKALLMAGGELPAAGHLPASTEKATFLENIFQYFRNAVHNSKPAQQYLQSRCLDFKLLEVGYNTGQFHHGARKDETLINQCLQHGLLLDNNLRAKTGEPAYSVFGKWCICFALRGKENQVTGLYFRSTLSPLSPGRGAGGEARHFYLKDRRGLYPAYPEPGTRKLILTESIIDAATLLQSNIFSLFTVHVSLLALYGTNGLSPEHLAAIKQLRELEEIIFFLNGDQAGIKSVEKYAPMLKAELSPFGGNGKGGVKITNVEVPENEDVNSLLQAHEAEILIHLLNERKEIKEQDFLFSDETEGSANTIENEHVVRENTSTETKKVESSATPAEPAPGASPFCSKLVTENPELLFYHSSELRITVLGGIRISGLDRLKVTLRIERRSATGHQQYAGQSIIRHSLDLYHARQAEQLTEMISSRFEISSTAAAGIIANLTTELEDYRQRRLESLKPQTREAYQMTEQERRQATDYLKSPDLMKNTLADIASGGIIGEQNNAITGYIVNLSRKREKPLHVMYLGASGSGKTHLQEQLALLVPREDRIEATGLSDQSLYYEGLKLKGKILFIEDLDGAENVMYIIRELQSKGRITKRVAWRDNKGNTKTVEIEAQGPVVISSCTTREKLYEDNANRCILLHVDQSRDQDQKIMDYMKSRSAGSIQESRQEEIHQKMQNVQRVLQPVKVYNPYAHLIELPPEVFKPRRSLPLLLGFIETLTFYHQYQREVNITETGERYIRSTFEDIEQSFAIMKEVLFSKSDELSRSAREFLEQLKQRVKPGESFYTKTIRKELRISASGLQRYMSELQSYGYVKAKSGNRYRGFEYQVNDYDEYQKLRQGIEKQLEAILLKIKEISNPVAHSSPQPQTGYLNIEEPVI